MWRTSSLQTILALGELEGVKLLHDVLKGESRRLGEVLRNLGVSLSFNSASAYARVPEN